MQITIIDTYGDGGYSYEDYKEICEENDIEPSPENSSDYWEFVSDEIQFSLECDRENLNVELDTEIVALASVGRWNGRSMGYKELGYNLNKILWSGDSIDDIHVGISDDGKNIEAVHMHHDGSHYVTFRAWKRNISDDTKEKALENVYDGDDTLYWNCTRSLVPDVQEIFGFRVKKIA